MIKIIFVLGTLISLFLFIVWRWVKGIDYMKQNHPDYKGEDLLDEN